MFTSSVKRHVKVVVRCWLRTLTHVNFNHVNKTEARYKVFEFKREVERGSTFTLTCDLTYVASILFINVNFMHIRE